jgi:hypothetical protein
MIEANAFRTFIKIHSLFRSELLSTNIKVTYQKGLVRSVLPHQRIRTDTYVLKWQRRQNDVLRITGNFARCVSAHDLHMAIVLPHIYDYITKLCRQQAEVIRNHDNEHVCTIGQSEARHRKYKRLELVGDQVDDRSGG